MEFAYTGNKNVLKIAHWQVKAGEHIFIQGDSGSGKSTLLNLISGISLATKGQINLLGQELSQLSGSQRDGFRAKHIGVVFQQMNLIPYLTVRDNILLAVHLASKRDKQVQKRIEQLAQSLQLESNLLNRKASELSVGQQQRVAIARALINQPALVLADEPTSALDFNARDAFIDLLLSSANANKSTILFVSHDQSLANKFDRTIDMKQLNLVLNEGLNSCG